MTTGNSLTVSPGNLPPTIRLYAQSLSPQECTKHRAWIGVRIEALLDGYWQSRPSDVVKAEIMADWMDALQNYSPDEIRVACREYLSGPNCDRKPKPGDLRGLIDARRHAEVMRHRASAPPEPEPVRDMSPEALEARRKSAEEIMAKFTGDRKFDGGKA